MAGTAGGREVAVFVESALEEAGLATEVVEYQAFLSLPRSIRVELTSPVAERLSVSEPADPADPDTADPRIGPGFVAYSASAVASAPVVYVNYGLPADYARLAAAGIAVDGRIALARYGKSHRAVKVHTAERSGAAGIIIYSDPADDGYARGDAWPAGPWRSSELIQRGNAKYGWLWQGDPLTPGEPARGAPRLAPAEAPTLPRIPAAVLSWREAEKILRRLAGPVGPPGFQGGLPFTYHAGPGPAAVRLDVAMDAGPRAVRDVIGRIPGRDPDRTVLLGGHHDAWTFGGVDPGSSAAVLLEVARALGELARSGWRPARSIAFAFWDAEEFGLVGSTEYAEEHAARLRDQVVAYVNSDLYMDGRFDPGGTPSLRDFVVEVARDVPEGGGSLQAAWRASEWRRQPPERRRRGIEGFEVELKPLGSGADFVAFQDHLGLPTLSLEFAFEGGSSGYGAYHSSADTRSYMERFGDPGFRRGLTLARVLGLVAMRLGSSELLPCRYSHSAARIVEHLRAAQEWALDEDGRRSVAFEPAPLIASALEVERQAARLEGRLDARLAAGRLRPDEARRLNDLIARAEQALLDETEPASRRWYRHVIYGWNVYSLYDGQPLPGLAESIRLGDQAAVDREAARIAAALRRLRAVVTEAEAVLP